MPAPRPSAIQPEQFATFGQLLRFLRQRAGLTQRELSIAVGYSESQMSRLEQNQRAPDKAALAARFVPGLHLEHEPEWVARLLELGAASRLEGRPAEPAPATPAPASPNNLPVQLTSFIGREAELAEIQQLLAGGVRLLTLTGPGGTGKTRLALEAAAGLLAAFPDGVWWVELAPLADPALVPQTVAAVLGVKEEPDRPVLATLTTRLRASRALLILDNCEHLIQASAQFAEAVLRACPRVFLLASSRELLGVAGERALLVSSLQTPDPHDTPSLDSLPGYEAVRLFVDRATTTTRFALTQENALAVIQVCQRLDGIPLALELAAARLRLLPVEQLAAHLDDAFRLLTGGSRTALPRHQTLQALIDWSYDLLPAAEQKLLRRLAVFAGGWTLEAAEAVCAAEGLEPSAVAELLGRLIDKSLVLMEERAGAARYRLMETVRQYAQARLAASGEADEVRRRHAEYHLAQAEAGAPGADTPSQVWLDQIEREHDNFRAALTWSLSAPGRVKLALRLSDVLGNREFVPRYGSAREAQVWYERALAEPDAANYPAEQARAIFGLGYSLHNRDNGSAEARFAECLRLFQALGDRLGSAWTLGGLGWSLWGQGDYRAAEARFAESLRLFQDLGHDRGSAWAICGLGFSVGGLGDYRAAEARFTECLKLFQAVGDRPGIARSLERLGWLARERGDADTACARLEQGLTLNRELGNREEIDQSTNSLAEALILRGDLAAAKAVLDGNLVRARQTGDNDVIGWALNHLGHVAQLQGDCEQARQLHEASLPAFHQLGPHHLGHVWAHQSLGEIALSQGDLPGAMTHFTEALVMSRDLGMLPEDSWCLAGLAGAAALDEDPERAAWLWGAAEKLRLSLGVREAPASHATHECLKTQARELIGEAAFVASWAAGEAASLSAAIEHALRAEALA